MGQVAVLARRGPMTAPGARGGPSVAGLLWGGTALAAGRAPLAPGASSARAPPQSDGALRWWGQLPGSRQASEPQRELHHPGAQRAM
jgi:hypothetical protein